MSHINFDESFVIAGTSAFKSIGLNETIILQRLHYWVNWKKKAEPNSNEHWIYNSLKGWHEQFPYISERTIQKCLSNLEGKGFIQTKFSRFRRKKFYTIDYDQCKLAAIKFIEPKDYQSDVPFHQNNAFVIANTSMILKIGFNQSFLLQRLHYWGRGIASKFERTSEDLDILVSQSDWESQFPFISGSTIQRTFKSLADMRLVKITYKDSGRQKFYAINYAQCEQMELSFLEMKERPSIAAYSPVKASCDPSNLSCHPVKSSSPYNKNSKSNNLTKILSQKSLQEAKLNIDKKTHNANGVEREMISIFDKVVLGDVQQTNYTASKAKLLSRYYAQFFGNDLQKWKDFCLKITRSKFLMGEKVAHFKVNLWFVLKAENIEKILEGFYREDRDVISLADFEASREQGAKIEQESLNGKSDDEVKFIQHCREKIRDFPVSSWAKEISLDRLGDEIILNTKSEFSKNHLESRYGVQMSNICESLFNTNQLEFRTNMQT